MEAHFPVLFLEDVRSDLAELNAVLGNSFDAKLIAEEQDLSCLFKPPAPPADLAEVHFGNGLSEVDTALDHIFEKMRAARAQRTRSFVVAEKGVSQTGQFSSGGGTRGDYSTLKRVFDSKEPTSVMVVVQKGSDDTQLQVLMDQVKTSLVGRYQKSKQEKAKLIVERGVADLLKCNGKVLRDVSRDFQEVIVSVDQIEAVVATVFEKSCPETVFKIDKRLVAVVAARQGGASNETVFSGWLARTDFPRAEAPNIREVVFLNLRG